MILSCTERSNLLLKGIPDSETMDSSQQQALLVYYQQQAALRNYLLTLQTLNRPPSTSPTTSVASAFSPVLHHTVLQNPQFLSAYMQQQQRATLFSQASLPSRFGDMLDKCQTDKLSQMGVSSQFAQMHLLTMQQDKQNKLRTEDSNLIVPLKNVDKTTEVVNAQSPKWETDSCTLISEAPILVAKLSSVSALDEIPSPSSISSASTSSDAERSSTTKDKIDDEEEMVYVDVESVDDKNAAKGQRKAHIEFYRKLKALRQREKILECQLCHDKIENQEHTVRTHVHSHSDTALYRCKMCGAESKEQSAMFAHTKRCHPNKSNVGFEDRRDMISLSNILLKCFPRVSPKTRIGYNEILDRMCRFAETNSVKELTCAVCLNNVQVQKNLISRHAHTHPQYRCKRCKLVSAEEGEMIGHCKGVHETVEPKIHKDYNACAAADVMVLVLKKCFPNLVED